MSSESALPLPSHVSPSWTLSFGTTTVLQPSMRYQPSLPRRSKAALGTAEQRLQALEAAEQRQRELLARPYLRAIERGSGGQQAAVDGCSPPKKVRVSPGCSPRPTNNYLQLFADDSSDPEVAKKMVRGALTLSAVAPPSHRIAPGADDVVASSTVDVLRRKLPMLDGKPLDLRTLKPENARIVVKYQKVFDHMAEEDSEFVQFRRQYLERIRSERLKAKGYVDDRASS